MKRPRSLSRWWLDLAIGDKGLLVVALPLVMAAAIGGGWFWLTDEQEKASALLVRADQSRDASQELLFSLVELEAGVHGYVLTADPRFLTLLDEGRRGIPERLHQLGAMRPGDVDAEAHRQASTLAARALDQASHIIRLVNEGRAHDDPEIKARLAELEQVMRRIRSGLGTLRHGFDALVAKRQERVSVLRSRFRPIIFVTFFAGLAGAVVAGWLFATGIAKRVNALERNAERLASGERLRVEHSRLGRDEIGSLDRVLRRASILLRTRDRELRDVNAALQRTVHEQALLNRELEAFTYSVSHDLRAPLRSIDGFAQALREDWGERLDETGQDHLARVRNAAQRMGRLIDDLLKLSKITRLQIQRSDVDLSQIARDISGELSERNPSRNVTWAIADDLQARCDPALARIVLENLLGNAWKFTSKTAAATIEFFAEDGFQPLRFVVRDNGAGFDMKYVDKLFAPFQRLHGEREFPGTGIGLATVRRIVHKHGGDVQTTAEVGRGATFSFTLEPADGRAAA